MSPNKPIASLSLDLDNQWSYMKIHGDSGWDTFPSYLDVVIPRALEFLQERQLTITFFIVGQDAALAKNQAALRSIAEAGHEIGNHSFHHESWLHLYSEAAIKAEFIRAEEHIELVTGQRPRGFRGPGYSFSPRILKVLVERGYEYDASTFPTYLGPLARAYYFMTSQLSSEEREQRKALFGGFKDGLQPLKPYWWQTEVMPLLEIPVTTMPLFKIPIHFSYILYLGSFSATLALLYFKLALRLCQLTSTPPSLLLHPLDFLSGEDVPELRFFPGMSMPLVRKQQLLTNTINLLAHQFTLLPMGEFARRFIDSNTIMSIKFMEASNSHGEIVKNTSIMHQP